MTKTQETFVTTVRIYTNDRKQFGPDLPHPEDGEWQHVNTHVEQETGSAGVVSYVVVSLWVRMKAAKEASK